MTQQQSKSNRESELFRKQGNEFYKLRNFDGAITLYGEAVLQAVDDSEQLASAYGNRSSAFYEISRFAESLRDVERALAVSSCPVTLLAKLLNRKDKCELNLENSKVKEKIDPLSALKSGWKNLERFPDISADVNVNYCKEKGRYLTASRDLEPGSVIIVEEAYASAFLPHQKDYFCHQCYSQLPLDFVPCKSCIDVKFCNFSCRDQAQDTFHKYECGNLEKLNNLGIAHLAIRVILATKPSVIADYIFSRGKQYQESDEKFIDFLIPTIDESEIFGVNFSVDTPDDVFFGRNYRTVYNMVTNRDQISLTDALMYAKVSGDAVRFLDEQCHLIDTIIGEITPSDGIDKTRNIVYTGLAGLLLRHIQQLICNAHTIVLQSEGYIIETPLQGKTKTSASYKMGSAVYPSVSLMNHSCDENTFTSYIGKTAVVRAVKKIKKGEEIFNCYGHRIGDGTSTDQRRKLLMQQYYFHCKCSACTSETVVKKERISMAFKCVRCSGPFCKLDEKVDAVATNFVCLDCGSTSDVSPDQIQSCIRRFWIINDSGKADQIFEAVKSLENLYHKFFLCLVSIRREACSALLKHGKINDCVDLMIRNLDCIAFHDGGQNLTFANEVLEELVYSVYFDKNLKRKDEVLKHIDKSIEIFTVYFGPNCHHVQILNDAKHFVG